MLMLMWQRWGDEALLNQCNFEIHWSTLLMLVMMFYWHWFWLCTCATLYCQYIALSWHICDRLHIHHILLGQGLFFLLSSRAHIFFILFQKQPFTPKNIKFGQILAWAALCFFLNGQWQKNLTKGPRIEWKSALDDFEWARHGACLCPRRNEYWQEMDEILQLMHFQVEASELGTLMVNCVQTTNIFLKNVFHSFSRRFLSRLIDEIFSYLHGWIIMVNCVQRTSPFLNLFNSFSR